MSFLDDLFGYGGQSQQSSSSSWWSPDPNKGDYRDLKPTDTQVEAYGKTFVDNAAARQYARITGKTKTCPHCFNDPIKRCNCSTCRHTGEVDVDYGVYF